MRVDSQHHTPVVLPGTHCVGGWVGPRDGLEWCGKFRPLTGFDPWTVQPVTSLCTDRDIPDPPYGHV